MFDPEKDDATRLGELFVAIMRTPVGTPVYVQTPDGRLCAVRVRRSQLPSGEEAIVISAGDA
jgi:hypothetical protein